MKYLKKYSLFESSTLLSDRYKDNIEDILMELTDTKFNVSYTSRFGIQTFEIKTKSENYPDNEFDITEIQDDILRVIDYLKSIGCLSHHFGITTDPATSIETNLPIKPTRLNNGRIVFVDNQDNIYYNVKVVKVWFSKDNFVRHQLYLINRTPKINESKVFKNIITKDEFPSEDQIKDYFYDLTDNVSDLSELLVRSGYVFFPTSDIDQSVKSEMMTDMDSDNWLDKEASSLAKTKWVDFFRPVTNLKHWDMSEFLPNDDVLNWYGEKRVEDYIFSEKLYNKIIKGDIPAYPTITINVRVFLDKEVDILIECLERLYESTGFRPVGDLNSEDYVDEDNGDIVTLFTADLKLCKCDDVEYKSLINHLGNGLKSENGTSRNHGSTVDNKNSLLLKKFL